MNSTRVPLGIPHGPVSAYIDPDEVFAYALAINDENPRYLDGTAVPPTYPVTPGYPVMMGMPPLPPDAIEGIRGGVHGEHDLYIRKPIRPGMHLHTTAERAAVVVSKAGMSVFPFLRSVDDEGEVVIEQYWSTLYLGEAAGGNHGTPPPDHSFPDVARERLVGRISLSTTRDQTFRYAGASCDRNPIHVNDKAAQRMGFPRKFHQGLCTLGITTRGLIELAAGGDPTRVNRVAVRFAAPVFPGDAIELAVYAIGKTEAGAEAYAFEAESAGRTVLRHGRFEVSSRGK